MIKFTLFTVMLFAATVFSYEDNDYRHDSQDLHCPTCTNPACAQIAYLTCLKTNEWNFLKNPTFITALAQLLRDTSPGGDISALPADVAAVVTAITSTVDPCTALKPPPCII